jgi:hypothetical protein
MVNDMALRFERSNVPGADPDSRKCPTAQRLVVMNQGDAS